MCAVVSCAPSPRGDLLAGRDPVNWRAAYRPERATDGVLAPEGEGWDSERATNFGPVGPGLLYDLGASSAIETVFLQGSADESWRVDVSADRHTWSTLWTAPVAAGTGLVTRRGDHLHAAARFVRVRPLGGDGRAGISELELHARDVARPSGRVSPGHARPVIAAVSAAQAWRKLLVGVIACAVFALRRRAPGGSLRDAVLAAAALALAAHWTFGVLAACVAVAVCAAVAVPRGGARARHVAPLALALAAAMAWTNFGRFAGYWSVHYHDAMHYYLGAKYAPEVGYDGLYRCVVAADVESQRWPIPPGRAVRDLADNRLRPFEAVAAERDRCVRRFRPARWAAFRDDVAFFQSQLTPAQWTQWVVDHGYNATPAWTWLARATILRDAPASTRSLEALAHVDEAFYAALVPLSLWALGLDAGALCLLVLALGFPWISLWVGGGIGRAPWLVATVAAVGLSRRGRPAAAGASLGVAASLLGFPAAFALGSVSACAVAIARRQRPPRDDVRLLVAMALTAAALLGAATASLGVEALRGFFANSAKHLDTFSPNQLGLLTALRAAGVPSGLARALRWPALAALAWAASRAKTAWERLVVSSVAPLVLFELSSYYGALCMVWAAFARARPVDGVVLLAVVAASQAPAVFAESELEPAYYAGCSAALLLTAAWLVARATRGRDDAKSVA